MNTYSDTNGKRYTTPQIEARIKKAGLELLDSQRLEFGYNFCQRCKRNDDKPIDVSHTISRKAAKENGNVEILWDKNNLEILGRNCHVKKDRLGLF
jgi:5-methylcytosine-specific restriction endonuclease McrA